MILPKALYEILPYGYMSAGVAEIGYFKTFISTGSGLLFFMAGALIWVLRSNHRRTDPKAARKSLDHNQSMYELKPFICIAISVLMFTWVNNWVALPVAAMFSLFGLYVLVQRSVNRNKRVAFSRNSL